MRYFNRKVLADVFKRGDVTPEFGETLERLEGLCEADFDLEIPEEKVSIIRKSGEAVSNAGKATIEGTVKVTKATGHGISTGFLATIHAPGKAKDKVKAKAQAKMVDVMAGMAAKAMEQMLEGIDENQDEN